MDLSSVPTAAVIHVDLNLVTMKRRLCYYWVLNHYYRKYKEENNFINTRAFLVLIKVNLTHDTKPTNTR